METHNRMLDRMVFAFNLFFVAVRSESTMPTPLPSCLIQGNDMDTSRGFLSGTVDKFKMVSDKGNK